jgi:MinD-like ATPase involved in chromosome partitioning or flagellar assembly
MATFTVLSAKGSPGVSTLAVGLALAWAGAAPGRKALAVDADPIGGDFAAGVLGGALPQGSGMIALATSRGVPAAEAVDAASVHLCGDGSARLLPGVPDGSRSGALVLAWDVLAGARPHLRDESVDLVVDAGRVDLSRPAMPWLTDTDHAMLLVRPTLPAVTAAHRFVATWTQVGAPTAGTPLAMVVVGAPSPYSPAEVAQAVGITCRAVIPFDPVAARVHSEGAASGRGFARSAYARAVAGLAATLGATLGAELDGDPVPGASPDCEAAGRAGGR